MSIGWRGYFLAGARQVRLINVANRDDLRLRKLCNNAADVMAAACSETENSDSDSIRAARTNSDNSALETLLDSLFVRSASFEPYAEVDPRATCPER
jgi:hypothetical protein